MIIENLTQMVQKQFGPGCYVQDQTPLLIGETSWYKVTNGPADLYVDTEGVFKTITIPSSVFDAKIKISHPVN